jgi:hypothetical protein
MHAAFDTARLLLLGVSPQVQSCGSASAPNLILSTCHNSFQKSSVADFNWSCPGRMLQPLIREGFAGAWCCKLDLWQIDRCYCVIIN